MRNVPEAQTVPSSATVLAFTALGTGPWLGMRGPNRAFSALLANTTTPTATIEIHATNDSAEVPSATSLVATLTMTGALDSAKVQVVNSFAYICAKCTAISGASASVTVKVGT